jgi:hypothetical protein
MPLSITIHSITIKVDAQHHFMPKINLLNVLIRLTKLSVIMLSVVMLSIVVLSVIMLSAVMLSVVIPSVLQSECYD